MNKDDDQNPSEKFLQTYIRRNSYMIRPVLIRFSNSIYKVMKFLLIVTHQSLSPLTVQASLISLLNTSIFLVLQVLVLTLLLPLSFSHLSKDNFTQYQQY